MRIVIIEDEAPARARLQKLLLDLRPEAQILQTFDTVEDSVAWFAQGNQPDLAFMDIQLADGLSFDIFRQTEVKAPVIFTTAYDQYALKAFKVNSVDYLLKPVDTNDLKEALSKWEGLRQVGAPPALMEDLLSRLRESVMERRHRERFLVRVGDQLRYVPTTDIAYLLSDNGYVTIVTHDGHKLLLDQSLEQLAKELDPAQFMQVGRNCIICIHAIRKIHTWHNSRLKLEVSPPSTDEILVSREKVKAFKEWLDR
jgi:DNA-binding LytR/AlgR family response regulator